MQFIGNRTFTRMPHTKGQFITTEKFDIDPAGQDLNVLTGKPARRITKTNEHGQQVKVTKPEVEDIEIKLNATEFQEAVMERMVGAAEFAAQIGTRTGDDDTIYHPLIGRNDSGQAKCAGHFALIPKQVGLRMLTDDGPVHIIHHKPPIHVYNGKELVCFVDETYVAEPIYRRDKNQAEAAAYAVMDPQQQFNSWKAELPHKELLAEKFPYMKFTDSVDGVPRRFDGVYVIPNGNEEEPCIDKIPRRSPSEVAEDTKKWICKNKLSTIVIGLIISTFTGLVAGSIVKYAPQPQSPGAPTVPEIDTPGFIAEISSFDTRCLNVSAAEQLDDSFVSSILNFARNIGVKYPGLWQHTSKGFSAEFSCPNVSNAISNLTLADWQNLASTLHASFEDQFAVLLQKLPPPAASAALALVSSPLTLACLAGLVVVGATPEMLALALTAMAFRDQPMVGMLALAVLHVLNELV
ncbi:hypothetical protein GCM10023165_27550 [Variovorax defluvii]|uniref:Uncharacterized protein n=1 Tax=Variovorax defluvii TaxID=913761 RepID=A0ABP8HTZ6_9BURK